MKISKIVGLVSAAAVSVSALAASASAYEAFLMFADADWGPQSMDATSYPAGNVDVTGDGTYTVSVAEFMVEDAETADMVPWAAEGATVFNVDINGLAEALGCGKGSDAYEALGNSATGADKMQVAKDAGLTVSDVTITCKNADGSTTDIAVDQSKIIFGDIEGNGKIRIEIYNAYGDTSKDAPIDPAAIAFDDSMSVSFTISGIDGDSAPDVIAPAPEDTTPADTTPVVDTTTSTDTGKGGAPDTGVEGIAAVAGVAVLAAGAVLVSKKRK